MPFVTATLRLLIAVAWFWCGLVHAGNQFYFAQENESADGPGNAPATEFNCSERIYAVAIFDTAENGSHTLTTRWLDPAGKVREKAESQFHFLGKSVKVWAWLKLHRPTGGGLVSVVNPSYGMEEFIGKWTVDFLLDGESIRQQQFEVIC